MHAGYTPKPKFLSFHPTTSCFSTYVSFSEYTPEAQIFVHFTLQWAFFQLHLFFSEKCTKSSQMTFTFSRSKIPMLMLHTQWGPNFSPFHSTMSVFELHPIFSEKCTKSSQMTFTCSRSKIPILMLHTQWGPNFSPFHSRMSHFRVMPVFWKSGPNDPKWPSHVQGEKYQCACYIYPPETLLFVRFTLKWAIFQLRHFFQKHTKYDTKWSQMSFTSSRSKKSIWMPHTPLKPKFLSVSLYNQAF